MKLRDALDDIFGSRAKVRILRVLFARPDREFTEREIAREARLSPNTVNLAMVDIRETKLLRYKRLGRTHSYMCNRSSVAYPMVADAFVAESATRDGLFALLKDRLSGVGAATVFGSFAEGAEGPGSDLDLLVVSDDPRRAREAVDRLAAEVLEVYSIVVSPTVVTASQLKKRQAPYVRQALQNGVKITGDL